MLRSDGIIILFILLFLSCQNTNSVKTINLSDLHGTWVLDTAKRNGTQTESLNGLFYTFNATKLKTNLTGDTAESDFSLSNNQIIQLAEDTLKYDIITLNDSTLKLSSTIRNMPFEFKFHKWISTSPASDTSDTQGSIQ
ncbi:MAG: lipocalin family protein [Saprospiraceae bacterium]|nr:lipocalin family protein [Saprospiraceae bacterium]